MNREWPRGLGRKGEGHTSERKAKAACENENGGRPRKAKKKELQCPYSGEVTFGGTSSASRGA